MRRIVTVGGIVVTAMLAGSIAAAAEPRAGSFPLAAPAGCVAPAEPGAVAPGSPAVPPTEPGAAVPGVPAGPPAPVGPADPGASNGPTPGASPAPGGATAPGATPSPAGAVPAVPVAMDPASGAGPAEPGLRPVRYLRCRSRWTRPPVLGPRSLHLRPPLTRPSWGRRQACLPPTLRLLRWAPGRQCLRHQLRLCLRLRPMPGRRCLHPHPQLIRRVPSPPGLRQGPGRLRPTLRLLRGRLGRRSATPRPPQARRTQRPCSRFRARSARCRSP